MCNTRAPYKYVAVIGIDGMGIFNRLTDTPFMDELFSKGAVSYEGLSMDPTISAENWGAMLLGTKPTVHKLTNSIVSCIPYENDAIPSVFRRIREVMPDAYLASCVNWNPINYGIIEDNVGVNKKTAGDDREVARLAVEVVAKKPAFLFVQLDDVDGAGHGFGYGEPGHLNQISIADGLVRQIYNAYADAGILADTLFVVTADHGGIDHGHGGYNDTEKYVFIGAVGKTVTPGDKITGYQTRDIADIVLYALGVPTPPYAENFYSSEAPAGIFPEKKGADRPEPTPRYPVSKPTPAIDGTEGLYSFIPEKDVSLALFLDNDTRDATGRQKTVEHGLCKYYSRGIYGSLGEFGLTGRIEVPDLQIGSGNFTVAMWLQIDRSLRDGKVVFAASNMETNGPATGIYLTMRCNDTILTLADGQLHFTVTTPFPEETSEGWVHMLFSINRDKKEISAYTDFEFVNTITTYDRFWADFCKAPFTVGDNSLGTYNREQNPGTFRMDDFLVFNKAFTGEDVAALKKYYDR